jgi:hypothetical protein
VSEQHLSRHNICQNISSVSNRDPLHVVLSVALRNCHHQMHSRHPCSRASEFSPANASLGEPVALSVALQSPLYLFFRDMCRSLVRTLNVVLSHAHNSNSPRTSAWHTYEVYECCAKVSVFQFSFFQFPWPYVTSNRAFFSGGSEVADTGGPSFPYMDEYVILENMS